MVRGSEFVHPIMRFSLRFPDGWEIVNGADQVSATESDKGNVMMLLELSPNKSGSPEQAARADMSKAGLRERTAEARASTDWTRTSPRTRASCRTRASLFRAAHIRSGQQMYIVAGWRRPRNSRVRIGCSARRSSRSGSCRYRRPIAFSRRASLSTRRAVATRGNRIAKQGGSGIRPATLAIMNGSDPAAAARGRAAPHRRRRLIRMAWRE